MKEERISAIISIERMMHDGSIGSFGSIGSGVDADKGFRGGGGEGGGGGGVGEGGVVRLEVLEKTSLKSALKRNSLASYTPSASKRVSFQGGFAQKDSFGWRFFRFVSFFRLKFLKSGGSVVCKRFRSKNPRNTESNFDWRHSKYLFYSITTPTFDIIVLRLKLLAILFGFLAKLS